MLKPRTQTHALKKLPGFGLCRLQVKACNTCRHHCVFKSSKLRQQMMKLKNKPELTVPELGQVPVAARKQISAAVYDFAGCRLINGSNNI